ncbi:cytochrome c3 family protein [Pseudodesulfovibrio thermohalotolerans]|uniref:cytochrome c3 family protein n=1 Tax=Pseudodesulfovibrio thermohalotolerans TaxID=2880651 RepID=UPI002442D670|nr:cytochrome c3 family protein [Pseudodesulfovibrio thermohalotolerans]WFS63468.1 cytochrome c3 family protein [Pseudodesulfovibrio thermohalotolerans]
MQSRYFPIAALIAVCVVTAVAGYAISPPDETEPVRVVMDNTGGRVIFTHSTHFDDYGFDCTDCHHDDTGLDTFLPCGSCHPAEFDERFRKEHPNNFPDSEACLRCHDEVPEGPLTEDERPDIANIPLRAEAFHGQCMGCHEENGGPYGDDSCNECHAR